MLLIPVSLAAGEPRIASDKASTVSEAPRIVVPEPSYYFGTVASNETLRHTFVFRNDGVKDLIIEKVSPA